MIKYKKKSAKLPKILTLIFAVFFVFLIFFILRSNFFIIKLIEIKKNMKGAFFPSRINCADDNQIKIFSHILGQNFFLLDEKAIESNLKDKFFCIKKIHLLKFFPNRIKMEVLGREPKAIFINSKDNQATVSASLEDIATPSAEIAEGAYLVDDEGVIFGKSLNMVEVPKIYLYDPNFAVGKKINYFGILRILEMLKTFGVNIKLGLIVDNFLIIYPTQNPKIIFRLSKNIDTQIASLQLILEKTKIDSDQLEFIDLRFDKPIVRIAPKKS